MTLRHLVEQASGLVVGVTIVLAVAAFVTIDAVRLTGRPEESRFRQWSAAAWCLGVVALVLAVVRVLVLA